MNERSFAAQLAEDLGPDDVRLVLGVFQSDVARLTGVLALTAAAGDATGFRRAAHGLAGAAGAVGAGALEAACRRGMAIAAGQAQAPVPELDAGLAEIRRMAEAALAELAAFVRDLDSSG